MIAMDVVTTQPSSDTMTNDGIGSGAMARRAIRASVACLAFHAGHMGAGLGWHGSIATYGPAGSDERDELVIFS